MDLVPYSNVVADKSNKNKYAEVEACLYFDFNRQTLRLQPFDKDSG